MENFDSVYKQIGYSFKDSKLLRRALTHSSYANENGCRDNERLEFLGDSVLGIIITEVLYKKYENSDEGGLSKMRASLVCEQSLEEIARTIELGNLIYLGKGEERTGGRNRASVVSDAFEALIAAIYLDSDMETVRKWVLNIMGDKIVHLRSDEYFGDYKTRLQEIVQSSGMSRIVYSVVDEQGQDHMKQFTVSVTVGGKELGRGKGFSKKEAEQKAAHAAVGRLTK